MSAKWVPWREAARQLMMDFEPAFGWGVAMKLAISALDGLLVEGRLEARAAALEWRLDHVDGSKEILASGTDADVPSEFWWQFLQTKDRYAGRLFLTTIGHQPDDPHAHIDHEGLRFHETEGFIASVKSMSGVARGIIVRCDQLPTMPPFKAPARRGRPPGRSALREADAPFIEMALDALMNGEKRSAVISRLSEQMPGGGTKESRAHRIRARLREIQIGGE